MKREFPCSPFEMASLVSGKLMMQGGEGYADVLEQLWKQLEAQRYFWEKLIVQEKL